ncbi:MAG: hypothetical protein AB7O80_15790 [Acetobacteraceae bacterium]
MRQFLTAGALALGLASAGAVVTGPSPAMAQAMHGAMVGGQVEARAVVESIDHATRTVLLHTADGRLLTVTVGPEVRNLAQVRAGDTVVARIRLGILAEMAPTGGEGGPAAAGEMAARAPEGARPGAMAGDALRVRVTLDSYNARTHTANITLPDGAKRTMVLQRKPMQDFAATLKPGDKVDVTVLRSVAIGVEPMKR